MFSDIGTGPAIIQHPAGQSEAFKNTAWTLQIIRGSILWAACGVLALPASAFYDLRLAYILPVAGVSAVLTGLASTAVHSQSRQLLLRQVVVNEITAQLLGGIVGIVIAVTSPTVWALVAASLTTAAISTCLSYRLPSHSHRLAINVECVKDQFRFGKWLTVSSSCTFLASGSDRLILGKLVDAGTLGVYNNALNLGQIPIQLMQGIGGRVLFPLLSKANREGNLADAFFRARGILIAAGGTMTGCLIIAGPLVVPIIFGQNASDSGWMVQFITFGMWFQILEAINSKVSFAHGETKWIAIGTLSRFGVIACLLPLSFKVGGLTATLTCIALADVPRYIVAVWGARRAGVAVALKDSVDTIILFVAIGLGMSLPILLADFGHYIITSISMMIFLSIWLGTRFALIQGVVRSVLAR